MKKNKTIRLDKFLSNNGYDSRRNIRILLKNEEVTINGIRAGEPGLRVDLDKDDVKINGQKIKYTKFVYYILNKPKGIISTSSDEFGRENVTDLIRTPYRVYPVGRLDKDTHGLILLTNDGELTHKLTHPRFHVPKVYELKIGGTVTQSHIDRLSNGIRLSDGVTLPANVKILEQTERSTFMQIEIFEGRYRQIRRMCDALRLNLIDLKRIYFGPVKLGDLKEGKYRELTNAELQGLQEAVEQKLKKN